MQAHYLSDMPEIHTVPLHKIYIDEDSTYIEFDDIDEIRWRVCIKTIHAWRITNTEYFDVVKVLNDILSSDGLLRRYPIVMENSVWIEELKNIKNSRERYLDNSIHLLFVLGEEIVEIIVGDNYEIIKV